MASENPIFGHLKAIAETKDLDFDNEEVRKDYNKYMINRYISMVDLYLPLVNEINKYDVPKETHYRYYQTALPKRKQYFKYLNKAKDLSDTDKQLISKYFEVGTNDAETYINILTEDQIQEILDIFKYGKGKGKLAGV
jgi:hypothetical protein